MNRKTGFWAALVLITGAALFLRAWDLGNRPFHADESVHAFKLWDLYEHGRYRYDPNEFHGPTLYYAALPILAAQHVRAFGDLTEADCRGAVSLAGALLVIVCGLLASAYGRRGAVLASAVMALSPAFVFYSRYFIQETLLVLFTATMILCWWQAARTRCTAWALACGGAAGLMLATKETAVLSLGAWALASWLFRLHEPGALAGGPEPGRPSRLREALGGAAVALAIATLLLTGMGRNWAAVPSYVASFRPWFYRAHGTDIHSHPWTYYVSLLLWHRQGAGSPIWTDGFTLALALVGAVVAFRSRDAASVLARRLAAFSASLLVIYSAVPYKTPWCVLSALLGAVVLAGVGAAWLLDAQRLWWRRATAAVVMVAGLAHMGWLAWQTSFRFQTDPRNPFVYAQTVPDAEEFRRRAESLAQVHPDGYRMVVKVFWKDEYYWPIPWYLRRFRNVGYWQGVPQDADAPLIFASPEFDEELTKRLDATHLMNGYIGLRPHVVAQVWVRLDLWTRFVESQPRPPEPP